MVQIGNGYYFLYIGIAVVFLGGLILVLRKRSRTCVHAVLLILLFLNFALHFLKQLFHPYIDRFPASLEDSALVNICAVSTVFFPFIYLPKRQNVLHDYAFFIGVCGGVAAMFYPTGAIGARPFIFNTVRFYFCHAILFTVPITAAVTGLYRPKFTSCVAIPLLFLAHQAIIALDEVFLIGTGLVQGSFHDLLNAEFRNQSLAFGPRGVFMFLKPLLDPFVPWFFKTDAFGLNGGVPFYFPVLWLYFPSFVYLIPGYILLTAPCWLVTLAQTRKTRKAKQGVKA